MRILSVGTMNGTSNTCVHRHWALQRIADQVDVVNTEEKPYTFYYKVANKLFSLGLPLSLPDISGSNKKIKNLVDNNRYDIVWIDKGVMINRSTLTYIKKRLPGCKVVSYSPDNMALRHNQSQNYLKSLPKYDFVFSNKSYIEEEMKRLGAKNFYFFDNMFEPEFHKPYDLTAEEEIELGGDVGFIGVWEQERADSIFHLANNGVKVRVFGTGKWNEYVGASPNLTIDNRFLSDQTYCKSLKAFKISLCFLRKMNFDVQTTRTMEIPACGGFMMAERTSEHENLFEDKKEAVYFSDNSELLDLCKYYLSHEEERVSIVQAGRERCLKSGYSTTQMIQKMINIVTT